MGRRCLMTAMVFCVSLALLPAPTWATCEQADLEGTWNTRLWRGVFQGKQCWNSYTLTIGPDGTITKGKHLEDCLDDKKYKITGGQLFISSGCIVEGTLETSDGTLYIERGGIAGDELVLDRAEN